MFKQKVSSVAVLAALSNIALASLAFAADDTLEEVSVKAPVEPKTALNLTKPNSTASRLGLSAMDTPASVESLDVATIKQRGDSSIREAISRSTGITDISNLGSGTAYSARGFTGNDSVTQAEDGIRLLTASSTLTYPSDTWGYQSIEVLRGPASVLFGDGAVGGIINSIRKAPSRENSFEAIVGAGTQGSYRAGVGGTGAVGEIGAFRIDASVKGGAGHVDRGDYDSQKLMTGLLLTPTDNLKINFTYDHGDESPSRYTGIPLRNGRIDSHLREQNYNISNPIQHFTDDRLRAKVEWQLSDELKLNNVAYWFNTRRHWRNLESYALDDATNTVIRDPESYYEIKHKQKQIGDRIELASISDVFGHGNRWVLGYEVAKVDFRYFDNFYDTNAPLTPLIPVKNFNRGEFQSDIPLTVDFKSETIQQGLFAEDAFDVTDRLKLSAGLRQDWISINRDNLINPPPNVDNDFSPFSYRFGAVFKLLPTTSLYGQFSKGSDPVSTLVTTSSTNLKLTTAKQVEAGIKHLLPNGKGQLTFAAYHIEKDDILTRDPANSNLPIQGGKQSSRGIELAASLIPAINWRTDLNMALLNARYDELLQGNAGISRAGNTPNDVPEKVANAWLYFQQPNWEAGIGARFVGKRYSSAANVNVLAGYTVYDANIAWKANAKTTLRASVRNLTDKLYAPVSYGESQFIIGESRRFELIAEFTY